MALLGNYSAIFKSPGFYYSNVGPAVQFPATQSPGAYRGRFYGETWNSLVTDHVSIPAGYYPPYTYILAPKAGGIGTNLGIRGLGNVSGLGAMGINKASAITGQGSISNAQLGLIVSAVSAIQGNSTLTAILNADLTLIANLIGSGQATAAIRALGNAIANLPGSGTITSTLTATGTLSADISPFTELSPQTLAAAVWNALASQYNINGSYGKVVKQIKNNTAAGL